MQLFKSGKPNKESSNSASLAKPSIGSLSIVDKIVCELHEERTSLIKEKEKTHTQKETLTKEIEKLNDEINILTRKRNEIQEQADVLSKKEDDLNQQVLELSNKISSITEESAKFESSVRSIKGISPNEFQQIEEDLKNPKTLTGHKEAIMCLDFDFVVSLTEENVMQESKMPSLLFTGSGDKSILSWSLKSFQPLSATPTQGWVTALQLMRKRDPISEAFSSNEENSDFNGQRDFEDFNDFYLFSGCSDGTLTIWNYEHEEVDERDEDFVAEDYSLESLCTLKGHTSAVLCLQADREKLLSGGRDKTIKKWDLNYSSSSVNATCDMTLKDHTSYVSCLQFFQYGLASAGGDASIRMWDLRTGECHRTLKGHEKGITCLQFDEVKVISGSHDKTLKVWDLRTGSCINTLHFDHPINAARFDHKRLIVAPLDKSVRVFDINTFKEEKVLTGHTGNVICLKFYDQTLFTGSTDCTVKMWSLK